MFLLALTILVATASRSCYRVHAHVHVHAHAEEGSESKLRTANNSPPRTRRQHHSSSPPTPTPTPPNKNGEESFLEWCHESLGIETLLEIQTFEYYDYIRAMQDRVDIFYEDCSDDEHEHGYDNDNDKDDDDENDYSIGSDPDYGLSVTDYPLVPVRGLAAAQNITVGDVVIRIPHASLWTVANCIDKDPVLGTPTVMGVQARTRHGWDSQVDEIPLLAVALLYHVGLGEESAFQPYIALLLQQQQQQQQDTNDTNTNTPPIMMESSTTSTIPHLWNSHRLRTQATAGVRKVAKGIKKDVQELYEAIVRVLIEEHPDLFGNPATAADADNNNDRMMAHRPEEEEDSEDDEEDEDDDSDDFLHDNDEWMFSLERFHWAFALVNSRHWYLKIPPASPFPANASNKNNDEMKDSTSHHDDEEPASAPNSESTESAHFSEQAAPPAAMPTDEWLGLQRKQQQKEEKEEDTLEEEPPNNDDFWPSGNSFLAPVADLLNFGPPCTRGVYNFTTQTFDIVATCNFTQGQEVTFWYADACQDVFVANYGFTHPMMVPPCVDNRLAVLQHELILALDELDRMDRELDTVLDVLEDCHCSGVPKQQQHHSHDETTIAPTTTTYTATTSTATAEAEAAQTKETGRKMPVAASSPSPPKKMTIVQEHTARHAIRGADKNKNRHHIMSPKDGLSRGTTRKQRIVNSRKSDL
jgi:hypothetical protein